MARSAGPTRRGAAPCGQYANAPRRCALPRPARVVEDRPRKRDQVGIASTDNGFSLLKLGDEADGDHRHAGCLLHRARQRHLNLEIRLPVREHR
jgi:hypothetical protein